tara:strand:- start:119 stop:502 length:384 start_codon:yes stop_codon:yes gene_type:complete
MANIKNKLKSIFKREETRWQNNSIAKILLFTPAMILSSVLTIPCIMLSLPLLILPIKYQKNGVQFLLRLQHTASLSLWYFVGVYLFPGVIKVPFYFDIILVLFGVYFGFKNTINKMVNETLEKQGFS